MTIFQRLSARGIAKQMIALFCLLGVGGCFGARSPKTPPAPESISPVPQDSSSATSSPDLSQAPIAKSRASPTVPSATNPEAGSTKPSNPAAPLPAKSPTPQDLAYLAQPYSVLDEFERSQFSVVSQDVFSTASLPNVSVSFKERDLLAVLMNTRAYFQTHGNQDRKVLRDGLLGRQGITVADVLNTLNFMIVILQEDLAANRTTRLKDPQFLKTNFQSIRWSPYNPDNPSQQKLRITKYAIFTHPGSRTKTATYNTALYQLNPGGDDHFYTQYTKQQVLSGLYEPGGQEFGRVRPLAYLTRTGLEEALLQGTILVKFTDGSSAYFNVDTNNGIAYVSGVPQKEQKRYWYFKEVDAIKGYGYQSQAKIPIRPGVTFAGDILNIGLGRIVALDTTVGGQPTLQLGVIADTGGAFAPNLHQLDFLAGIFPSRAAFSDYARQQSDHGTAYILIRRQ